MTIGGFGRITPLQGDMLCLGGLVLGRGGELDAPDEMRLEAMRRALGRLRRRTKADHGFDLGAWHELLQAEFRDDYCHPYGWRTTSKRVAALLNDPDRMRLVQLLQTGG